MAVTNSHKTGSIEALLEEKGWVPCGDTADKAIELCSVYLSTQGLKDRLEVAICDNSDSSKFWIATMPNEIYLRHMNSEGTDFKHVALTFGQEIYGMCYFKINHLKTMGCLASFIPILFGGFLGGYFSETVSEMASLVPVLDVFLDGLSNPLLIDGYGISQLTTRAFFGCVLGGLLGYATAMFASHELLKPYCDQLVSKFEKEYHTKTGTAALEYLQAQ